MLKGVIQVSSLSPQATYRFGVNRSRKFATEVSEAKLIWSLKEVTCHGGFSLRWRRRSERMDHGKRGYKRGRREWAVPVTVGQCQAGRPEGCQVTLVRVRPGEPLVSVPPGVARSWR